MKPATLLFVALSLLSVALSVEGWVHGDWWGAMGLVLTLTFVLIAAVTRLHADPKNRIV
jgi:hypothetical protein